MLRYELNQLSNPATYEQDATLNQIARSAATKNYQLMGCGKMGMGEFKNQFAQGQYPELVLAEIESLNAVEIEKSRAIEHARMAVETLDLPAGWSATVTLKSIELRGPYHAEMPARLRRLGGDWDRDEKVWNIPHAKSDSLKRIFGNAEKVAAAKLAQAAAEKQAAAAEKQAAQQERDRIYAEKVAASQAAQKPSEPAKPAAPKQSRTLFAEGTGPALNTPIRRGNGVRVYTGIGKSFRISEDDPSIHGSHLLGHEGDYGCYYYWREADAGEIASLELSEQAARIAAEAKTARVAEIASIRETIQTTGERPEGVSSPEGKRLLDTANIYGSGDWFVVGHEWVWYCRNNGMDGDNWASNNVRTGGAGAIGWRIPYDQGMAEKLTRHNGKNET